MLPDLLVVAFAVYLVICLNAPTGAWCSLTPRKEPSCLMPSLSQCTYRCVVLPDATFAILSAALITVSMHLQVRGAP